MYRLLKVLALFIIVICVGCDSKNDEIRCTQPQSIQAIYNTNLPLYQSLNNPNGYVVLEPDGTNGSRGLILVNTGNTIKAYDRNAPHVCPDSNTTLTVLDDIKIFCPKDSAQWLLISGQPINDATNGQSPYQYFVQQDGQNVIISN